MPTKITPEKRAAYEATRKTETLKLRLSPDASAALRLAAKQRSLTASEYVSGLALGRWRMRPVASPDGTAEPLGAPASASAGQMLEDLFCEVSRLAHAVHMLPLGVRQLRAELGRQGGLAKHLIETGVGEPYSRETAEVVRSVGVAAEKADAAVEALLEATAQVRHDLGKAAKLLASCMLGKAP
jgi:hypothetical protein